MTIFLVIAVDDGGPASTRKSKATYDVDMLQDTAQQQLFRSARSENVLAALRLCDTSTSDGLPINFHVLTSTHLPLHRENDSTPPSPSDSKFCHRSGLF